MLSRLSFDNISIDWTITDMCVAMQSEKLASELVQKLPAAALAALIGTLSVSSADVARAAEYYTPPGSSGSTAEAVRQQAPQSVEFPAGSTAVAPAVKGGEYQLPEGNQWRYSEFINAVQAGKVERVRFSKEGGQLQACAPHALGTCRQQPSGNSCRTAAQVHAHAVQCRPKNAERPKNRAFVHPHATCIYKAALVGLLQH